MGLFSSGKDVDPRTGRNAADTRRMQAKWDAKQAGLAKQNKETRKMLQQNQSRRKSGSN
jgi:hypothetical protein